MQLSILCFILYIASVNALGMSNVFGILGERRKRVEQVQHARERYAAKHGYAGPNGEPLTAEEYLELSKRHRGLAGVVQGWMRKFPRA
ncbi:hypothetical protein MPSEU_000019300 [Mayamaea pseudoterrestris]|nr:hypothetical protein MPSEU_000019300 [Mayamaea pseudoterrestris]